MYHPIMATGAGSYVQFITVLIIFVVVLGITAMTTKWIAGYQKKQTENSNMEVVETSRIASNKYLQIVRVGKNILSSLSARIPLLICVRYPRSSLSSGKIPRGWGSGSFLRRL